MRGPCTRFTCQKLHADASGCTASFSPPAATSAPVGRSNVADDDDDDDDDNNNDDDDDAQPPIIFEIDSDHNRAMLELAKRPYADRLKECLSPAHALLLS